MHISGIQKFTMLDFPEHVAAIVFTPGCNMRCKFCHNKEFVLPEEIKKIAPSFISEEAVCTFLESRKGLLDGVVISGGEPTLQKDLRTFIERVRAMGFLIKLDTNGNQPDVVKELLEANMLDYVAMDVKTTLGGYGDLVGDGAQPDRLAQSIALLKDSSVPHEFRTTMIKEIHTPEVITQMKELLAGAQQYSLQTFRPRNTLDSVFEKYHALSIAEMRDIQQEFAHVVEVVNIR